MSDRPTPEQIASGDGTMTDNWYGQRVLNDLAEHGYVIVHPDDHPYNCGSIDPEYRSGWRGLHHRIFGVGDQ